MHRELLAHPHVGSFSALLVLAFLAAWFLARWNAGLLHVECRHIDNHALLLVACSMFGARFFSWLFYFPKGANFWKAMIAVDGGLVFYGGVIFSLAGVVAYALLRKLSLRQLANIWAAPVALGLAIGRIGCFMSGCCWGDVCMPAAREVDIKTSLAKRQVFTVPLLSPSRFPLGVRFPVETGAYEQHRELGLIPANSALSLPVHPAQLYEAAAVLLLAVFLQRRFARRPSDGRLLTMLALGYGMIRFFVEFLRADNPPIYCGLTLSQVISLLLITWAIVERHLARRPSEATRATREGALAEAGLS